MSLKMITTWLFVIFIISTISTIASAFSFQYPPVRPSPITKIFRSSSSLSSSFRISSVVLLATEQQNEQLEGECLADWKFTQSQSTSGTVSKDSILRHTFVADLLTDGAIESSEIENIWIKYIGKDIVDDINVDAFARFWYAVDDLFAEEEVDDERQEKKFQDNDDAESTIQEIWLDQFAKESYYNSNGASSSLGESINLGEVVLLVPNVATIPELQSLFSAGLAAYENEPKSTSTNRRSRFPARSSMHFPTLDTTLTAESILLNTLDRLDTSVPSIFDQLFLSSPGWASRQPLNARMEQPTVEPPGYLADTCYSLRDLYMAGEMEWSEGEPAINIYHKGGYFGAHKDHLGLTVLVPLTLPATTDNDGGDGGFQGGGTGFWVGNRVTPENPVGGMDGATTVIRPDGLGWALVFGGDVTHAGMEVEDGVRGVLVASFSTRTEVSPEDRVQGLQRGGEEG